MFVAWRQSIFSLAVGEECYVLLASDGLSGWAESRSRVITSIDRGRLIGTTFAAQAAGSPWADSLTGKLKELACNGLPFPLTSL